MKNNHVKQAQTPSVLGYIYVVQGKEIFRPLCEGPKHQLQRIKRGLKIEEFRGANEVRACRWEIRPVVMVFGTGAVAQ